MKAFIFILFLTLTFYAKAQLDVSFINHLSVNNLQKEHYHYLNNPPGLSDVDSVKYYKAKYFIQYFNADSLLLYFTTSRELFLQDTCSVLTASLIFLKQKDSIRTRWFSLLPVERLSGTGRLLTEKYLAGRKPDNYPCDSIPPELLHEYIKLKKFNNKNPLVAAGLSIFIPGLGKQYAGRTLSFAVTFSTHVFFALQSYELLTRSALIRPFTLFSFAYFLGFYLANIYGSFEAVKQERLQLKNQFYINVSEYYTVSPPCSLY